MSWPEIALEEIAEVKGGKRLPKGHDFVDYPTPHPYIRARDIGEGKIEIQEPVYLLESTHRLIKGYIVNKDNVVVTIVGANIGDVGYIGENLDGANLTENAAKLIVNKSKFNPYYLKLYLSTTQSKKRLSFIASGAAQGKLGLYKIKSFKVTNPPLDAQQNIVEIVKNYDDLIENNKRRIELLEESARQLYKEWFVRFRFPGHEHVKIVNGVPQGWKVTDFGDVAKISKGKNITKESSIEGSVPVVAGGLSPAYYHNSSNTECPVITVSASGANAGYVNLYHEKIWASDCSYIERSDKLPIYYIYLLLKYRQNEITGMQKGAAQPHVYPKDLMRLVVCLPPDKLILQSSEYISDNFKSIQNLQNQNKFLSKARDLLLPKLMSGEIAV